MRGGCFNHFEGGSIYWTSATGAHPVWGMFRATWSQRGWERSGWGYPVSGEVHPAGTPSNHRVQDFEHGYLYWNGSDVIGEFWDPRTGAVTKLR